MPAKKYKLHSSAADDGKAPPCAFFVSEHGCRNGENCKFAHSVADNGSKNNGTKKEAMKVEQVPADDRSIVSSESGGGGGGRGGGNESMDVDENPFANPFETSPDEKVGSKRKNRRGTNTDPFPKKPMSQKTSTADASPPKAKETPKAPATPSNNKTPSATSATKSSKKKASSSGAVDFRSLNLPIADFTLASANNHAKTPGPESTPATAEKKDTKKDTKLPLPKSTEIGRKWLFSVEESQKDSRFTRYFDFEKCIADDEDIGGKTAWIKAKKFGNWCKSNPQVLAIDCEMCETEDPVSKKRNYSALCRVSIVDAETDEVLLNTLVKPEWPIVDCRTFINGIKEDDLANVQFTVRHCQAFMMALCSEETVIVGHAVHHDLKSMRMEHYCVADSSLLFRAADSETATVSLKDLSSSLLGKEMPKTHDSVNDARAALCCMEQYVDKKGKVEPIVRKVVKENKNAPSQLFVHRIPKHVTATHLTEMFLSTTKVAVDSVNDIDYSGAGQMGKTLITFSSPAHANLAFSFLTGSAEEDATGRMQKKVFLRGGKYIRIRKMVHERSYDRTPSNPKIKSPPASKVSTSS